MAEISVWAPKASLVELDRSDLRIGMEKHHSGWWISNDPQIEHGMDYAFYVDGEGPFPDPRSHWQPQGVHASSRWYDHAHFSWNDAGWQQPPLSSAIIYELHVGTFTPKGTFDSIIDHLDYLVDLGITHIELMPVAEFSGNRGWGYDGVDLYAPHHAYGGPQGLKQLVDACHQKGLAVLLDVVYNHLGPSGNYLNRYGPYFTNRHSSPWGDAYNLDGPDSDEVRRFIIDNALMWLRDYHIDGLRIDAVHAIRDTSSTHILEELAAKVDGLEAALGRHLVLIAESDLNDPRLIRPFEAGGYGIDAQWNEDFHHALHAFLSRELDGYYQDFGMLADLAKVLTQGFVYDGCFSSYRRRLHGRPATGISNHRLIGCLQNHDQVGNRASGERTSHLLSQDLLKIGAALVLTSPFVPMLFQGEEWAASTPFLYFTDYQEPELRDSIREGRKKEFASFKWNLNDIPDPQSEETFIQSKLDWNESKLERHHTLLEWHRSLIRLRRQLPDLNEGQKEQTSVLFDEAKRWLLMTRGSVRVACNFSDSTQHISCPEPVPREVILFSKPNVLMADSRISLPPNSVAILHT